MERETARIADEGSGLSDPISLTLPSSPEYVLLARLVMGQVGRLAGLQPEEVYDLKLAVTEAVTNVIRHASVETYEIDYRVLPLGVQVSVTDAGGGFSVADLTGESDDHGGVWPPPFPHPGDGLGVDANQGGGARVE